jgi:hypothetical protein
LYNNYIMKQEKNRKRYAGWSAWRRSTAAAAHANTEDEHEQATLYVADGGLEVGAVRPPDTP